MIYKVRLKGEGTETPTPTFPMARVSLFAEVYHRLLHSKRVKIAVETFHAGEVGTGARKLGGQPSHYSSYFSLADLPPFLHFHPMTLDA